VGESLNLGKKNTQVEELQPEAAPLLFFPMFKTYIENSRLSEGRRNHAISNMNHWQRFADKNKLTLTFNSITPDLLRAFEKFLLSEEKVQDEKKVSVRGINTLHAIFALTRAFINYARKEFKVQGIEIPYPFDSYTVPSEVYGTPIYLTMEERNLLFEADIKNERLAQVRDIFIFQCLIGCRVGDLCNLKRNNINNNILSYIPRKTK